MKKIMFNDKYGLTKAVLERRKTQTRRIVDLSTLSKMQIDCLDDENSDLGILTMCNLLDESRFQVGEEVALAQAYKNIESKLPMPISDNELEKKQAYHIYGDMAGWHNKMFVKAELMPHRIRITDMRIERLQDISEDDCLKEGVSKIPLVGDYTFEIDKVLDSSSRLTAYRTPRAAFAALIDKVSGKGTWDSNPLVFVYDFELRKKRLYKKRKI